MSTGGKYTFDRYDTALYVVGNKPGDYAPHHGMVILDYTDIDVILQLMVYSPNRLSEESTYAWGLYRWDESIEQYKLESANVAIFDDSKSATEQTLPSKNKIGMIVYRRLLGI